MKKLCLKRLSFSVGAAVVLSALGAVGGSPAFALESTWLVDGVKPTSAISYSARWELLFEDLKGGLFLEDIQMVCTGTAGGTVGPGAHSDVSNSTVIGCKTEKACPEPDSAAAKALSWEGAITLIGTEFYNSLTSLGYVGYNLTCSGLTDECGALDRLVRLKNDVSGEVLAEYDGTDGNQPPSFCSRGGTGQGLMFGTELITVPGKTVTVNEG